MAFLLIKFNLLMTELVSMLKYSFLYWIFTLFFECGHGKSRG